ncbi:MAG: DUF1835 domain-containing protein [Chitinophagaceae bacterium]
MIHIVFQEPDIATLQAAIALDSSLEGEVWHIKDDFAVGPIASIFETEGYQQRRNWWKQLLEHSPYTEQIDLVDDKLTVHNLIKQLETGATVWVWMGQNAHDVCGYYWLMSQLKPYQGQVYVLYLNNLPFINEKGGIFYPSALHQIQPKEFLKAKKLARPITLSEFEVDPDEWKRLMLENAMVRILEGGKKIVSKPNDYFDKAILSVVPNDWVKLPKLLQLIFSKAKVNTGDVFVVHRLQAMASDGTIDVSGDWTKGWKEIVVRMPNGELALA